MNNLDSNLKNIKNMKTNDNKSLVLVPIVNGDFDFTNYIPRASYKVLFGENLPEGYVTTGGIDKIILADANSRVLDNIINSFLINYLAPQRNSPTHHCGDDKYFDYIPDAIEQILYYAAGINAHEYMRALKALYDDEIIDLLYVHNEDDEYQEYFLPEPFPRSVTRYLANVPDLNELILNRENPDPEHSIQIPDVTLEELWNNN